VTVKERVNELLEAARSSDTAAPERAEPVEQARRLCREHKIGMVAFDWPDAEIVDTAACGRSSRMRAPPTAAWPRSRRRCGRGEWTSCDGGGLHPLKQIKSGEYGGPKTYVV
jgi:hypothetical protein